MIDMKNVENGSVVHQLIDHCKKLGWTPVMYFRIPRIGWEMDNDGIVARDSKGRHHLLETSHGKVRVGNAMSLIEHVALLETALAEQNRALAIFAQEQ